jgi:inosose dehydratase
MKAAINSCTWGAYAQFTKTTLTAEHFFAEAAEAGYAGVEVGGGEGFLGKPEQCLKLAEKHGLQIAAYGTSVTYNPWPPNTQAYKADIDYAAQLGVKTLMVCGGFMPVQRRRTFEFDYDMFAGNFGALMKAAAKRGIAAAFHPHRGCIVETQDEAQKMVKRLKDIVFCVDTAHLEGAGSDALKFIRTFGKRCVYSHLKDFRWDTQEFTELGKGKSKLNVAACVKELGKQGSCEWLCVELDKRFSGEKPRTPLQSAKISRAYLKNKCGV